MGHNTRLSRRSVLGQTGAFLAFSPVLARAEETLPPLAEFGKLPAIGKVAISPDGKRVAFVSQGDGLRLVEVDVETGARTYADIPNANGVPVLIWASNTSVFYTASRTEKSMGMRYETWAGYLLNIRTSKRYRVYTEMPEYGMNLVGDFHRIRRNGAYYITASNFRVTAANYLVDYITSIYAFALGHGAIRLDEDGRRIVDWAVTGDGKVLARSEFDDDTRLWTLRYKGDRGWRVIYSRKCDGELPSLKGVGRDGRSVLIYFREEPFIDSYVELRPDGTFSAPLVSNRSRHSPIFSPATNRLAGFASTSGIADYILYDPAYAAFPQKLASFAAGAYVEISDVAEAATQMVVYTEASRQPGAYAAINTDTGQIMPLGSSYPNLSGAQLAPKSRITYAAGDGLMIEAMLTKPARSVAGPHALVVLVHGGPESYDDERFDWMAQALASRGYMVLQPNYRGSSGYGHGFVAKGYGEWGRKMQTDLSDGVRSLVDHGLVDSARVAIAGASYGGYAAMAGISLQSGVYRCAVAISGISDVRAYMADMLRDARYNRSHRTFVYWSRFVGPEADWDAISPATHAAAITAPLLLIHGRDDAVVGVEQSYRMRDALKARGKPVELVQLSDEDHYLSKEPTRIQTLESMVAFVLQHNPPR